MLAESHEAGSMSKSSVNDGEAGIYQKRTLAFINHFIIRTIEFMNSFAVQCETKLMEVENKIQKTEASLIILETKLASIPEIQLLDTHVKKEDNRKEDKKETKDEETVETKKEEKPEIKNEIKEENADPDPPDAPVENTKRDPRYEKFFKMVQFGVPVEAVKLKITQEGLDPSVLTK